MPEIDSTLIQIVAIGAGAVVLLVLLLTLQRRRRAGAAEGDADGAEVPAESDAATASAEDLGPEDEANDGSRDVVRPEEEAVQSPLHDDGVGEGMEEDAVHAENEHGSREPVAGGHVADRSSFVPADGGPGGNGNPERALSSEPVFSRRGGLAPNEFEASESDTEQRTSAVWEEASEDDGTNNGDGSPDDRARVDAGWERAEGRAAQPVAAEASGEPPAGQDDVAPGAGEDSRVDGVATERAGAEEPREEPESQPFEREGRWWFRRDGELLVFEESSGEWAPVEAGPWPTRTEALAAEADTAPSSVKTEPSPQEPEISWPDRTFWKCGTCGAVNGATAATCRMCFAPSP
jgi:hypothetical protein